MARPIQATPKLNSRQTVAFLNRLCTDRGEKEIIDLGDSVKTVRGKRDAGRRSAKK